MNKKAKNKEKTKKMNNILAEDIVLNIPDDEVYTYHIEGLAAPHINKPYKNYGVKKAVFIAVIIVAVSLSMFFSLMILRTEPFEYKELSDGTYQFTKFSNPGYIYELEINCVQDIVYPDSNEKSPVGSEPEREYPLLGNGAPLLKTKEELLAFQQKEADLDASYNKYQSDKKTPVYEVISEPSKTVSSIKAYAINGDGYLKKIKIGPSVTDIDGKAFYSCWALQYIEVDDNNPNYCDIDGVLYSKDKKTVICYPCDRDQYLRDKYNYPKEMWQWVPSDTKGNPLMSEEDYAPIFEEYKELIMTYAIPETVETVGELCFNYSNLATVYLPEGLKKIDNLGFFEMPNMKHFYTYYQPERPLTGTEYKDAKNLNCYLSLPDTLTYIGTDAFSFNKEMEYVFIPKSVTFIGHHAFWENCYYDDGQIKGMSVIAVELGKEEFNNNTEAGDQWIPIYNSNTLKKLPVEYGATRKSCP